jgi:uncharacterized protein (TIGR00369 family)
MDNVLSKAKSGSEKDFLDRLLKEMERPPYHGFLRPRPERVDRESGTVVITLPFRSEFRRSPDGPGYHGGVIASLIDLSAHAAVAIRIGRMAPTVDLRIDFLRVAGDGDLKATARVLRAGRTLALADVEITDGDARLIAVGRGTFSTAQARKAAPIHPTDVGREKG